MKAARASKYDGLECRRLEKAQDAPIPLDIIRRYVDAHHSVDDDFIRDLGRRGASYAEERTSRSVFWTKWELTHCRGDINIPWAPVRQVESVSVKRGRSWSQVDMGNEDVFERIWKNDESNYIVLKEWQSDQKVRVIYFAGYQLTDYMQNKMPYHISQLILNECKAIYRSEPMNKERQDCEKNLLSNAFPDGRKLFLW